jgi:hypothetical protein
MASAFTQSTSAALPPHSAVRLCLTAKHLRLTGGYASQFEAQPQKKKRQASERRSLSALCGGRAALVRN